MSLFLDPRPSSARRFHELSHFDDTKRSCRLRLAGHNERRRRNPAEAQDQHGGRGDPGSHHLQIR